MQQLLGACVVSGHSRIRGGGALGGKRRGVNKAAVQLQCDPLSRQPTTTLQGSHAVRNGRTLNCAGCLCRMKTPSKEQLGACFIFGIVIVDWVVGDMW